LLGSILVDLGLQVFEQAPQLGDAFPSGEPDKSVVDCRIVMGKDITKRDDLGEVGYGSREVGIQPPNVVQRFPDDLADSSSGANTHTGPAGLGWWDGRATT
jgi:hypothetical protein